ncbi:hypothetical protein OsJ_15643 [Oryza sativa Japonica Group]|uniref:Uncharacterized protein n=1 Tax=Oryza sativa subsp. japonica TaxID=39947 RepID=A3AW17_ORYSJ|nr:hypothetical protein OsJ_15643 [Oryza sativa Japonica Group]
MAMTPQAARRDPPPRRSRGQRGPGSKDETAENVTSPFGPFPVGTGAPGGPQFAVTPGSPCLARKPGPGARGFPREWLLGATRVKPGKGGRLFKAAASIRIGIGANSKDQGHYGVAANVVDVPWGRVWLVRAAGVELRPLAHQ